MKCWAPLSVIAALVTGCGTTSLVKGNSTDAVLIEGKGRTPGCEFVGHVCGARVVGVDGKFLGPLTPNVELDPGRHLLTLLCSVEYPTTGSVVSEKQISTRIAKFDLHPNGKYRIGYEVDGRDCKLSLIDSANNQSVEEVKSN